MNVIWIIILSCVVSLGFCLPQTNIENSHFNKDSVLFDPSTHEAKITLSATPSTGYSWFIKSCPTELIKNIRYKYTAPSESSTVVGRAGTASFTFTLADNAVGVPRLIPVVLTNARPWQPMDGKDKTVWLIVTAS